MIRLRKLDLVIHLEQIAKRTTDRQTRQELAALMRCIDHYQTSTTVATKWPSPKAFPDGRYLSPCPEGWDTVLGFIARFRPDMLAFIDADCPEATVRDEFWLKHRCREAGIQPCKVQAPAVLREQGIEEVNAYPVALLVQRLGQ